MESHLEGFEKAGIRSTHLEDRFQLEGIVVEMPVLVSVDQRKEYLKRLTVPTVSVPLDRRPLLQRAIDQERKALGYGSRLRLDGGLHEAAR